MKKLYKYSLSLSMFFLSFGAYTAERIFYEDMEYNNFTEHFMERSYGTVYSDFWDEILTGPANITQSTDAYSGSYSMQLNLFSAASGRNVGLGDVGNGNTSKFNLSTAITGTKVFFRWKQKFQPGADWGGFLSKLFRLNLRDMGDFTFSLIKGGGTSWISTVHTNDPYEFKLQDYFHAKDVFDGEWHTMELYLDWTGQEDSDGGNCVQVDDLSYDSRDGNGIIRFMIDGELQYEKTDTCFYTDVVPGPTLHHVEWPSNKSGKGGSVEQLTWLDDLEIWDDIPNNESHSYTILNPGMVSSGVVSLADNNVITTGNTTLNLDRYERGEFNSNTGALTQGTVVTGTGPFEMGSIADATDVPAHTTLAGTQFVIPHTRDSHLYYLISPDGDASAQINLNGLQHQVSLPQGVVVEFDAGENNGNISAVINSDRPILVTHRGDSVNGSWFSDACPVPPAATELWGIRSNQAFIGAVEDDTHVTLYASNNTTSTMTLNAGQKYRVNVGVSGVESLQGRGSAIHLVADKPIGAVQFADGDGSDQTAFFQRTLLSTRFGIPVNAQYIAVACPEENTTVTLYNGSDSPITNTCSANGNYPGKAYFGSAVNGTAGIQQGAYLESDKPIHVIYEATPSQDEHNLMGTQEP